LNLLRNFQSEEDLRISCQK